MRNMKVGLLHPGEMGASVGASVKAGGHDVYWASVGRSEDTHQRAQRVGLQDVESLQALCDQAEVILSVCPPHAAEDVLDSVLERGFEGIYVDANAISPQKSIRMASVCDSTDVIYVDGGIIGGPAWKANSTFLYLCGVEAEMVAALFADGLFVTRLLGDQIGRASALKMCFAAYSKGSTALISMILAGADSLGVQDELLQIWSHDGSDFAEKARERTRRVTRKAWRFAGEMDEIADTFGGEGLPEGFHRASAQIYARMSQFKHVAELPSLEEVTRSLPCNES